jgi:hypothetical protein
MTNYYNQRMYYIELALEILKKGASTPPFYSD